MNIFFDNEKGRLVEMADEKDVDLTSAVAITVVVASRKRRQGRRSC